MRLEHGVQKNASLVGFWLLPEHRRGRIDNSNPRLPLDQRELAEGEVTGIQFPEPTDFDWRVDWVDHMVTGRC